MRSKFLLPVAALLCVLLSPATLLAMLQPNEQLQDPVLEARAVALGNELKCVVCQSESINDSPAGIAADIRALVREQVKAGKPDADILAFLKARYGDAIMLEPPFQGDTFLLWFAPWGAVMSGGFIILRHRKNLRRGA